MKKLCNYSAQVLLLAVTVLFIEIFLQLLSIHLPDVHTATTPSWKRATGPGRWIEDESGWILGGNPDYWEHDELGYRNTNVYRSPELVTIGDSFTYGTGVDRENTWPSLLDSLYGISTYNMGIGGTGPLDYLNRFRQALQLSPRFVTVAVWLGNDLIFSREIYDDATALEDVDSDLLEEAMILENNVPWWKEAAFFWRCGYTAETPEAGKLAKDRLKWGYQLRHWVSDNSRLYGLLRTAKDIAFMNHRSDALSLTPAQEYEQALRRLLPEQFTLCYPFAGDGIYTIFDNGWRQKTLDISDPRIATGMLILKSVLTSMRDLAQDANVTLFVLIIPTKERVFRPQIKTMGIDNPISAKQLRFIGTNEPLLEKELVRFMNVEGIASVSLITSLRQSELQPFFGSRDAHINDEGHRIVAAEVFKWISRMTQR